MGIIRKKAVVTIGKKPKKNTWSLSQFIFWGFNYIVGYAFIVGLNKSFSPVGVFLPAIIFIGALISFVTGFSFARMSQRYVSNGGAYLYVKKIFGKKVAYYAGFFQYAQAPIVALSAFLGMLWAFHGIAIPGQPSGKGDSASALTWWIGGLAALLFIIAYLVMIFGFTSTKYSLYFLWLLKWSVIIFSMALALVFAGSLFRENLAHSQANPFSNNQGFHLSTIAIIQSVITFFFAFGGFEGIAVVSEDVDNPEKNVAIALVVIIILAFCFYMVYYILILGSLGSSINSDGGRIGPGGTDGGKALDTNPINQLLSKVLKRGPLTFAAGAGIGLLLAVVIASQLANKTTSRFMNGWVNARMLAVISKDGFLPQRFSTQNKYKQFKAALLLDLWLSLILIILFYPLYLATSYNIADAIDLYTISAFIQYLFVLMCVIKVKLKEGSKSRIRLFEFWAYVIMFFVIIFIIVSYFYFGFQQGIESLQNKQNVSKNIGGIATSITTIFLIGFAFVLYYIGKKLGWHAKGEKEDADFSHHHDLGDIEAQPSL